MLDAPTRFDPKHGTAPSFIKAVVLPEVILGGVLDDLRQIKCIFDRSVKKRPFIERERSPELLIHNQ